MASTISSLIASAEGGDRTAVDTLFTALYSELHRLAKRQLGRSKGDMTLGVTTLLHEAYLDISRREGASFPDRGRFMAYAAKVMRGVIIDYARRRTSSFAIPMSIEGGTNPIRNFGFREVPGAGVQLV